MKKTIAIIGCLFLMGSIRAQTISQRLQSAFQKFEADSQLRHALSSLYVIDAKTGEVVFEKNAMVGLAGASTQKIITAATAFELLGKDYRYKTSFLNANQGVILTAGNGDPTLGSWRYASTTDSVIFSVIRNALAKKKIKTLKNFAGFFFEDVRNIPSGWIYEDIGNYYGAAPHKLNWRENQYDVTFIPGDSEGDETELDTSRTYDSKNLRNEVSTGKKGSGDNAYVYINPVQNGHAFIQGTVPAGEKRFTISAADQNPAEHFGSDLIKYMTNAGLMSRAEYPGISYWNNNHSALFNADTIYIHYSPSLDSIVYWFLKKSINLYGEALVRTFATEQDKPASTDTGVAIVKKFWKDKGLDVDELNMYDGSGLSPMNRITTHVQVEVLKYARSRPWFSYFYNALPDYNGMRMKSGTIGDVKGFCGYHKAKDGREYIFSFLVNNYSGKTSPVVGKMYRVLDELK